MSDPKDYTEITDKMPPAPSAEKAMSFWGHLEELRGTLIKCVITFAIFAGLIGYFMSEFNHLLMLPLDEARKAYPGVTVELGTTSVMEVFNMILQMCLLGGLVLSAPFMLVFIGQFVAPALSAKEKRAVIPLCLSAFVLFLIGAAFGFFLLMPSTLRIAIELNQSFDLVFRWTVGAYYSTLSWLVLGVGATFEFPLVVVLMVWIGIMTTAFLRKYRRHAIVVIFVISAVVTPTPDPFTLTILAAPLYLLYEVAILASVRVEKRKKAL